MEVIGKQLKEFEFLDELLENKEIFSSIHLFKCILGLNKTESQVFGYLLRHNNISTSEIANALKMDRSSIQRAIQNLSELKLIYRKSVSMKEYSNKKSKTKIKKQGYLYVYSAKEIEAIKIQLKVLLDKWYGSMLKYIENLDDLCECCGLKLGSY